MKQKAKSDDVVTIQAKLPRYKLEWLRLAAGEFGGQTLNGLLNGIIDEWLNARLEEVWQRRAERLEEELRELRRKPKVKVGAGR